MYRGKTGEKMVIYNQGERTLMEQTVFSLISILQNCQKISFHGLSHPVFGTLLQLSQQTNTCYKTLLPSKVFSRYNIFVFSKILCREGNGTPLQYSCLENPIDEGAWQAAVHGVAKSRTRLSDFTFTFHFHALEKEMATHSSVLAWRIPGTGAPGVLPSMGSHRVGHD